LFRVRDGRPSPLLKQTLRLTSSAQSDTFIILKGVGFDRIPPCVS